MTAHDNNTDDGDHGGRQNRDGELLTIAEVADILRVPPATLRYWRPQQRTSQSPHRPSRPLRPHRRRDLAPRPATSVTRRPDQCKTAQRLPGRSG